MDKSTPVADRVRPILHAMERSIDAARRRRLHPDDVADATSTPAPPVGREAPIVGEDDVPRMKARPKRPAFDSNAPFRSPAR